MRAQGLECMKHEGSGTGVHEALGLRDWSE